jgi:hypothetical protein
VGSLALTHLAPPQAVELLSWSAVGRDLCQHDAMSLGCQVAATSAGLAAACPSRDQRPGGARCGMRGSPCPRDRPCGRPAAALRPGGDRRSPGVPTHPSRRRHGDARLHNMGTTSSTAAPAATPSDAAISPGMDEAHPPARPPWAGSPSSCAGTADRRFIADGVVCRDVGVPASDSASGPPTGLENFGRSPSLGS